MADKSLSDITVEERVEDTTAQVASIVEDIKFEGKDIMYRSLESSSWNEMLEIGDLLENQPTEVIGDDLNVPDSLVGSLEELRHQVIRCWNDDIGMFELEKRLDEDGDLEKLVLPFGTEHTEDIVIERLYDSSGGFVADNIKDSLNGELHKLWGMDLYVKSPDSNRIYTADGNLSYSELLGYELERHNSSYSVSTYMFQLLASGFITVVTLMILMPFIYLYGIPGFMIWLSFVTVGMVPLIAMVVFFSNLYLCYRVAKQYVSGNNVRAKILSTVENA